MPLATWYVNTEGTLRVHPLKLLVDEEIQARIDWNAYVGNKETTAQNVTFEADGNVVTISGATLSGGVSTVEIGAANEGMAMVKATLECSSGEVLVRKFLVSVIDPDTSGATDYQ